MIHVSLFGDSHSLFFKHFEHPQIHLNLHAIIGATITGLPRRDSTLQVGNKIKQEIKKATVDFLVLKFGQIDVELGYYYKKLVKRKDLEINQYIEGVISDYSIFLNSLLTFFNGKILVFGINLPSTINNEQAMKYQKQNFIAEIKGPDRERFLKQLKETYPNIKERTKLHLRFNNLLKDFCERTSLDYIDVVSPFLDKKSLIIKEEFSVETDHHYKGLVSHLNFLKPFYIFNEILTQAVLERS